MAKFAIKNIEAVKGKQLFKQLIIVDDKVDVRELQKQIDEIEFRNKRIDEGEIKEAKTELISGVLDLYEISLETKYQSPFRRILMNMNLVADLQNVPPNKFKYLPTAKNEVKEFEFKYGDLRVYGIDIFGGKLILLGGYKNQQPNDISKFRSLKKFYLESCIKTIKNEKGRIDKK